MISAFSYVAVAEDKAELQASDVREAALVAACPTTLAAPETAFAAALTLSKRPAWLSWDTTVVMRRAMIPILFKIIRFKGGFLI
jgi:hypothetical protein